MLTSVMLAFLILSLAANLVQAYFFVKKRQKREPVLTMAAEDLLHDLTRGPAVLKVEVIDAKNLFLRSPRL